MHAKSEEVGLVATARYELKNPVRVRDIRGFLTRLDMVFVIKFSGFRTIIELCM